MADETVLRIKERIRQEMRDLLGVTMADGSIDRQALPAQIDGVAHEVCADFGISDENWIGYIIKSTIDDFIGLGPLQPLQDDPKVAEIFIDPSASSRMEHLSRRSPAPKWTARSSIAPVSTSVSHDEVGRLIGRICRGGEPPSDDSFPDGRRLSRRIPIARNPPRRSPPTAGRSISVTSARTSLTAEDLLERGAMSEPMYMFLKSAVKAGANFIISG